MIYFLIWSQTWSILFDSRIEYSPLTVPQYTNTHTHIYIHTHTHIHKHTHMHTNTYAYIHIHTWARSVLWASSLFPLKLGPMSSFWCHSFDLGCFAPVEFDEHFPAVISSGKYSSTVIRLHWKQGTRPGQTLPRRLPFLYWAMIWHALHPANVIQPAIFPTLPLGEK